VGVSRALARAAIRLDWIPEQTALLLVCAQKLLTGVEPVELHEAVEDAARAAKKLARRLEVESLPERIEETILEVIDPISRYDLRDILDRTGDWIPTSSTSARMADFGCGRQLTLKSTIDGTAGDDQEL
jgi:hypothetical protein